MKPAFIVLICFWTAMILMLRRRRQDGAVIQMIRKKKNKKEKATMFELAKQFVGQRCIVSTINAVSGYIGTVKEVSEGGLLLDDGKHLELFNLDFVTSIKEYPAKKKKDA